MTPDPTCCGHPMTLTGRCFSIDRKRSSASKLYRCRVCFRTQKVGEHWLRRKDTVGQAKHEVHGLIAQDKLDRELYHDLRDRAVGRTTVIHRPRFAFR